MQHASLEVRMLSECRVHQEKGHGIEGRHDNQVGEAIRPGALLKPAMQVHDAIEDQPTEEQRKAAR